MPQNRIFKRDSSILATKSSSPDLCSFSKWLESPRYWHHLVPPSPGLPNAHSRFCRRKENVVCHLEKGRFFWELKAMNSRKCFSDVWDFNETQDVHCQVAPMFIFKLSLCYHIFAQNTAFCSSAFLFAYISVQHS